MTIFMALPLRPALLALPLALLCGCASSPGGGSADTAEGSAARRLAERAEQDRQLDLAAGLFAQAHQQEPRNGEILVSLGRVRLKQGDARGAAQAYRAALTVQPELAAARAGLGRSFLALNQPENAAEEFRAAVTLAAGDPWNHNGLGVALDIAGQHAAAQAAYREGLAQIPGHPALTNNLGLSLLLSGAVQEAIAVLEPLGRSVSATPQHRQNLALAYGLDGQAAQARDMGMQDLAAADVEKNLVFYERVRRERPLLPRVLPRPDDLEGPAIIPVPVPPVTAAHQDVGPETMARAASGNRSDPEPLTPAGAKKSFGVTAPPAARTGSTDIAPQPTAPSPLPEPAARLIPSAPTELFVQLGRYTSEEQALDAFARYLRRDHPQLTPSAFALALPNGGNYWRLKLTGFADAVAAQMFCATLNDKGVSCLVMGG